MISNKRSLDCSSCDRKAQFDKHTVDETSNNNNNNKHLDTQEFEETKRNAETVVRFFYFPSFSGILYIYYQGNMNFQCQTITTHHKLLLKCFAD